MRNQTFRDLRPDEIDWLAAQRGRIEALLDRDAVALAKYRTDPGKLGLIQGVLDAKAFRADQRFELQGVGIILGDVLANRLRMDWRMVEDEHGVSPCLVLKGTSVVLFPQTMISKRIERGEQVDVLAFFNGIVAKVEEIRAEGA